MSPSDVAKTDAIKATPPPSNVSDLRSFLGTCSYVCKFIPSYATIDEPLRKLTRKGQKSTWEKEQAKAFKALKEALSDAPVLACFSLNVPTYVITDASPVGLGAILLSVNRSPTLVDHSHRWNGGVAEELRLGGRTSTQLFVWH